jgi:AcrR family transcriptional regulator
VSASWFRQHFGSREALLTAARVALHERSLQRKSTYLAHILEHATCAAQLRASIRHVVVVVESTPLAQRTRWQRLQLLAAGLSDPVLRVAMGTHVGLASDTGAVAVRRAQERGIIRADLPPRALARFLGTFWFARLLQEVDGDRVDHEDLAVVADRVLDAVLCEPGTGHPPSAPGPS